MACSEDKFISDGMLAGLESRHYLRVWHAMPAGTGAELASSVG